MTQEKIKTILEMCHNCIILVPNRGYDIYAFAQDIINYLAESEK